MELGQLLTILTEEKAEKHRLIYTTSNELSTFNYLLPPWRYSTSINTPLEHTPMVRCISTDFTIKCRENYRKNLADWASSAGAISKALSSLNGMVQCVTETVPGLITYDLSHHSKSSAGDPLRCSYRNNLRPRPGCHHGHVCSDAGQDRGI